MSHRSEFRRVVWTPEFAYAVGLLTADGNLSPDGRHLEICSKDRENVVHFQQCLNLQTKLALKGRGTPPFRTYYRTQCSHVSLYRFLERIGLHPRKSRTIKAIMVPPRYVADFLRGVWDGDGGLVTFRHPESRLTQWKARISSGSHAFLEWLRCTIEQRYAIPGKIYRTRHIFQLVYTKRTGSHLLRRMYYHPDVICLSRKRQQALRLLRSRACGGTGRRAGFRILSREGWGFNSLHAQAFI